MNKTQKVLTHLRNIGSITRLEAMFLYNEPNLPKPIFDLREAGFDITTERKRDANGNLYAKYTLASA